MLASMELNTEKDSSTSLETQRKIVIDFLNVELTGMNIPQSKVDEIKQLVASIKYKIGRCRTMERIVDGSALSNHIKSDLLGNCAVSDDSGAPDTEAYVPFGLNEMDISINRKETDLQEKNFPTSKISKALFSDRVECFPPKLLCKKMDSLKAVLSLNEEYNSTMECLEENKNLILEIKDLLLLKEQKCKEAANVLCNRLLKLNFEARLLKYRSLLAFYTTNKRVVDASYKLKESILSELEQLQAKEADLKMKMVAFKQLKGTKFDKLLSDYDAICKSISEKQWTLRSLE